MSGIMLDGELLLVAEDRAHGAQALRTMTPARMSLITSSASIASAKALDARLLNPVLRGTSYASLTACPKKPAAGHFDG